MSELRVPYPTPGRKRKTEVEGSLDTSKVGEPDRSDPRDPEDRSGRGIARQPRIMRFVIARLKLVAGIAEEERHGRWKENGETSTGSKRMRVA